MTSNLILNLRAKRVKELAEPLVDYVTRGCVFTRWIHADDRKSSESKQRKQSRL